MDTLLLIHFSTWVPQRMHIIFFVSFKFYLWFLKQCLPGTWLALGPGGRSLDSGLIIQGFLYGLFTSLGFVILSHICESKPVETSIAGDGSQFGIQSESPCLPSIRNITFLRFIVTIREYLPYDFTSLISQQMPYIWTSPNFKCL